MTQLTLERLTDGQISERFSVTLPCTIGRSPDSDLTFAEGHINPAHGQLAIVDDIVWYTDNRSANGTIHRRGNRLTPLGGKVRNAEVWDGDLLELGDATSPIVLRVVIESAPASVIARRELSHPDPWTQRVTDNADRFDINESLGC